MSTASVTNTFVNAATADADEVNTNFSDLVTFLNGSVVHVDGSKAFTGTIAGVTPTADAHLTRKDYVDALGIGETAQLTSDVTIGDSAYATIDWDQARQTGSDGLWAVGNPSRLTAAGTGWHIAVAQIQWTGNATGQRRVVLIRNTTSMAETYLAADTTVTLVQQAVGVVYMTAGQYMEVKVFQSSGGNLDVTASKSQFSLARLSLKN